MRSLRIPAPVKVLLALDLLFGALHLVGPHLPDALAEARFWNLNAERGTATWYATLQLSLIGILLLAYAAGRRAGAAKWAFAVAGLVALLMSLDEQTRLHDRFARVAESAFGDGALDRSGPWVLIVAPVFLLTVALVARGAREALRDRAVVARLLVAGTLLFVAAFAGIEVFRNFVSPAGPLDDFLTLREEIGELLGATLVLWGSYELLRSDGILSDGGEPLPGAREHAQASPAHGSETT